MTHNTIVTFFWITFLLGLALGLTLYIMWIRRIWKRLLNVKRFRTSEMAARTLVFSFPGFIVLIVFMIPAFYFNHLIKNEEYCKELVRANPSLDPNSSIIRESCDCYDTDELFSVRNESRID